MYIKHLIIYKYLRVLNHHIKYLKNREKILKELRFPSERRICEINLNDVLTYRIYEKNEDAEGYVVGTIHNYPGNRIVSHHLYCVKTKTKKWGTMQRREDRSIQNIYFKYE